MWTKTTVIDVKKTLLTELWGERRKHRGAKSWCGGEKTQGGIRVLCSLHPPSFPSCKRKWQTQFDLKETRSGEKQNKCNQCNYESSQASTLKTHIWKVSEKVTNKPNLTIVDTIVRTTGDWEMVKEDTVRDQTEGWGRKSFSLVTFDEDDDDFDDADQERGGVIWGQWGGFFFARGCCQNLRVLWLPQYQTLRGGGGREEVSHWREAKKWNREEKEKFSRRERETLNAVSQFWEEKEKSRVNIFREEKEKFSQTSCFKRRDFYFN